jgi:hypothetical protein
MESTTVHVLLTELETARKSLDRAVACLVPAPKILNNQGRKSSKPAPLSPTIKFVTENGFTIERDCEREESPSDSASSCHFVVGGPDDEERRVTVVFVEEAIRQVQRQRSIPLGLNSPFWLGCAERHLATYLWEKNDCPPVGRLTIDKLSAENLYVAMRAQ